MPKPCHCCGATGHCFCSFHVDEWNGKPACRGCMKHDVKDREVKTPQPGGGVLVEMVREHVCS